MTSHRIPSILVKQLQHFKCVFHSLSTNRIFFLFFTNSIQSHPCLNSQCGSPIMMKNHLLPIMVPIFMVVSISLQLPQNRKCRQNSTITQAMNTTMVALQLLIQNFPSQKPMRSMNTLTQKSNNLNHDVTSNLTNLHFYHHETNLFVEEYEKNFFLH